MRATTTLLLLLLGAGPSTAVGSEALGARGGARGDVAPQAWPRPPAERLRAPRTPERVPDPAVTGEAGPPEDEVHPWRSSDYPLGVARFGLVTDSGDTWMDELVMPLYREPDGELLGWLARGWFLAAEPASVEGAEGDFPIDRRSTVEAGYETLSFVVTETGDERWFRLRLTGGEREVRPWARLDRAESPEELEVETWTERLLDRSPLHLRDDEPHALRLEPDGGAERLLWITREHEIQPIVAQAGGDWMFVRVSWPRTACRFEAGVEGRFVEGWMRWRDEERGPLLWYASRGC